VEKVKLEEELALYKGTHLFLGIYICSLCLEKVDQAFGMVAKLLANLAIVNGLSFFV